MEGSLSLSQLAHWQAGHQTIVQPNHILEFPLHQQILKGTVHFLNVTFLLKPGDIPEVSLQCDGGDRVSSGLQATADS